MNHLKPSLVIIAAAAIVSALAAIVSIQSTVDRRPHALRSDANPRSAAPEPCPIEPKDLAHDSNDILYVEALSSQPTDGTYADDGYGQGEFETVRLLEVLKSQVRWEPGHVFWVHPFPGKQNENEAFEPEHLGIGRRYYLLYIYHLDKQPEGISELIGLARCGVLEDKPGVRTQLLEGIRKSSASGT